MKMENDDPTVMKKSYSQIGQDRWVIQTLKKKKNGTYVDIGGGHPVIINNTYGLEKEFNWSGISVDIGPPHTHRCESLSLGDYELFWKKERNNLICGDALKFDYKNLFKEHKLPKIIDYLSLDLSPPMVTWEVLQKIPFLEYTFNVITFETDFYRDTGTQAPSREFLQNLGYNMVLSNSQDDWYIHESCKF
jgi:hypothetical protein